jgi:hypothetical protein
LARWNGESIHCLKKQTSVPVQKAQKQSAVVDLPKVSLLKRQAATLGKKGFTKAYGSKTKWTAVEFLNGLQDDFTLVATQMT